MEYSKELIEFAEKFSENYPTYTEGRYLSAQGNYTIDYKDIDKKTPARISKKSEVKVIEINKRKIDRNDNLTYEFIYWLILWCQTISEMPEDFGGADREVTEHYLTTRKSKKQLLVGFINMVGPVPSSMNQRRYDALNEYLLESQDNTSEEIITP